MLFNTKTNDNHSEILRIIIYEFVSTNIIILTKIESNFYINVFYFMFNFVSIIVSHIYSIENRNYFLEAMTSFFVSLIFYCMRKEWDYKLRLLFSKKFKYQRLFMYTNEFINGLNGYHMTIQNNNNIYINKKFSNFVYKFLKNEIQPFIESNKIFNPKNISNKINEEIYENINLPGDFKHNRILENEESVRMELFEKFLFLRDPNLNLEDSTEICECETNCIYNKIKDHKDKLKKN